MAQGKYVALIGHDDIWGKDKIEIQVTFLEEHPAYNLCFPFTQLPNGTQVEVIGTEDNGWVKILLTEREGYVCGDYLTVSDCLLYTSRCV